MHDQSLSEFLNAPIHWRPTGDPLAPYKSTWNGRMLIIRLNDFPDDQLYTLIADKHELGSFDDWPHQWSRPSALKQILISIPRLLSGFITAHKHDKI